MCASVSTFHFGQSTPPSFQFSFSAPTATPPPSLQPSPLMSLASLGAASRSLHPDLVRVPSPPQATTLPSPPSPPPASMLPLPPSRWSPPPSTLPLPPASWSLLPPDAMPPEGEASPPSLETPRLDWRPTGLDMFTLGTRAALGSVGGKLQSGRLAAKARWRWARLSISDRNFYEEQAMAYPSSPDAVLQRVSVRAAMFAGAVAGSLTGTMGQLSQPPHAHSGMHHPGRWTDRTLAVHPRERRRDTIQPRLQRQGVRPGYTQGGATAQPTPPLGQGQGQSGRAVCYFIWSALGRSGAVGCCVCRLMLAASLLVCVMLATSTHTCDAHLRPAHMHICPTLSSL